MSRPRRKRCADCTKLYPPAELTDDDGTLVCPGCLVDRRAGDIDQLFRDPDPDDQGSLIGVPVAESFHASLADLAAGEPVTMYATPGVGDGTPCDVPAGDVTRRLVQGWGMMRGEADRIGVDVAEVRQAAMNALRDDAIHGAEVEHQVEAGDAGPLPELPDSAYPPDATPLKWQPGDAIPPGGLPAEALPAPTVQRRLPELDPRTEDERERDWEALPDLRVPGWPLRRGRISASALGTFARCPEQFRQKYVLGRPDPMSGGGLTGTAVHATLNLNWRYKMANGEDGPLDQLEEAFDAAFEQRTEREEDHAGAVDWGHDGTKEKRPMTIDAWRGRGKEALGAYMLHVAPRVEPHACEELFVVQVAGLAVPVVGFLDLRTSRAMVDVKFGKKRSFKVSPEWRIQGLTYLLAHDLPMEWHSLNWKGEFATPADSAGLILQRTSEQYGIALDLVRSSVAGILAYADRFGTDETWPGALTHTWACSTCAFEPTCRWWHRPFNEGGLL